MTSTAHVPTDPALARVLARRARRAKEDPALAAERRERVVTAAIHWIYDKTCSHALADLEDAVIELTGIPLGEEL